MPSYYTYLIATLPALYFADRPPCSFAQFIAYCQRLISDKDIQILKKASITAGCATEEAHPVLKKWYEFDTALRNELVKIRATRKHIELAQYLRRDKFPEPFIARVAINAYRNPAILNAEKMLDQERWRILDEFSLGHYFDLDFLIIYVLKLLLLERWERINATDKAQALSEALAKR